MTFNSKTAALDWRLTRRLKKPSRVCISHFLIHQVRTIDLIKNLIHKSLANNRICKAIEINNEDKSKFLDALVAVMQ